MATYDQAVKAVATADKTTAQIINMRVFTTGIAEHRKTYYVFELDNDDVIFVHRLNMHKLCSSNIASDILYDFAHFFKYPSLFNEDTLIRIFGRTKLSYVNVVVEPNHQYILSSATNETDHNVVEQIITNINIRPNIDTLIDELRQKYNELQASQQDKAQ